MVRFAGNDCNRQGLGPATHGQPYEGDLGVQKKCREHHLAREKEKRPAKKICGSTIFYFAKSLMPNHWRLSLFTFAIFI